MHVLFSFSEVIKLLKLISNFDYRLDNFILIQQIVHKLEMGAS